VILSGLRPRRVAVGDRDELDLANDPAALELVRDLNPKPLEDFKAALIVSLAGVNQKRPAMARGPPPILDVLAGVNDRPRPRLLYGQREHQSR
jgi:hypothetical protein